MSSKLMQENLRLSDGTVQDSATTATKTQDTVLLYSSQWNYESPSLSSTS